MPGNLKKTVIYEKKIVFISHYFFPFSKVGALRTSLFTEYLAARGYSITVFKAHDSYYGNNVLSELTTNREIRIFSVSIKNSKNRSINQIRFTYQYYKQISNFLKNEKADLLFFSGGPFFYFILGPVLKSKFTIPYILDFRDIWFRHPLFKTHGYKGIEKWTDNFLEKKSIKNARFIIDVTETCTEIHRKLYRTVDPEKFYTIYNGFEKLQRKKNNPPLLSKTDKTNSNKLSIGIFGKFGFYNPEHINWILNLEGDIPEIAGKIEITVIGEPEKIFLEKSKEAKLVSFVFRGQKTNQEGMYILKDMNALLLNNYFFFALGTKLFDYIALNKPIIALVKNDWEIARVLNRFDRKIIAPDYNTFKEGIKTIITEKWTKLTDGTDIIQSFSREKQFEKLENLIAEL